MTTKTAQNIARLNDRIAEMEAAIGRAYLRGDHDGIGYYEMHLKAYRAELERAEAEADEDAAEETGFERCVGIARRTRADYEARTQHWNDVCERFEVDSTMERRAHQAMMRAWNRYDAQVELVAELFGITAKDVWDAVDADE